MSQLKRMAQQFKGYKIKLCCEASCVGFGDAGDKPGVAITPLIPLKGKTILIDSRCIITHVNGQAQAKQRNRFSHSV